MSADAENEYFTDGMAEEIINALTKIQSLRVTSRTSSFSFKGKNEDIAEIGKSSRSRRFSREACERWETVFASRPSS